MAASMGQQARIWGLATAVFLILLWLLGDVLLPFILGGALSYLLDPLAELHGATRSAVGLTFTVTLAVVGATAGFGGLLHNRHGPRTVATAAGLPL